VEEHLLPSTRTIEPAALVFATHLPLHPTPGSITVNVPFATKLTVKCDTRCRTLDSHTLEIMSPGTGGGAPVKEALAGVFGGKTIPVRPLSPLFHPKRQTGV
jgi:hypothetical protein